MALSRIIVLLFGTLFAAVGLGFWAAPELTAGYFDLEAIGVAGLVTARADLGGLFIGLAGLCLAGVVTRRRSFLVAAATLLGAIAFGRLIGLVGGSTDRAQIAALAAEIAAVAALVVCARRTGSAQVASGTERRRSWLLRGGVVAALGVGAAATLLLPAEAWIVDRLAAEAAARDNSRVLEDTALRVGICGSSAPLPSPDRAKACVAVFAGGRFYLVDVGPESVENLVRWGIPLSRIGGVLLTHFHSDHIGDLGELNLQTWAQGRPAPLDVYGGPGVEQVVDGFNQAYRMDQGFRTAHHTERLMPPDTWPLVARRIELEGPAAPERSRAALVLDDGQLRITAIEVNHDPVTPAYAYRFDYKGRSVVVSGDLKFHPPLAAGAQGADVLVIEAISRPMVRALENGASAGGRDRQAAIMHDIQDYHVSPVEAAELANRGNVKLLVFYHLLPAPDSVAARRLFARDVDRVRSRDWILADDGGLYTLPIGSNDVRIGRVDR